MFKDRVDAGRRLATALKAYADKPDTVVFGIPRGGVVVAAEVARLLRLPLDVIVAAKVGAPGFEEYAVGAIAPDGEITVNPSAGYTQDQVARLAAPVRGLVKRRLESFRVGKPPIQLEGVTAIVVDDGLATGLTAIAAVDYLRRSRAASVVLAVPVSAPDAATILSAHVDELVVLEEPYGFSAVGQAYESFGQTDDAEVLRLLRE